MRLPTVPTNSVVEHLNTTYFNRVWNAPRDNRRRNFELYKAAQRIQTGAVPIGQSVVGLPTTDTVYAVYQTALSNFDGYASLPDQTWVSDADVFLLTNSTLRVYGSSGRLCPYGKIHIMALPLRKQALIAIDIKHTRACIGESFPSLWTTVFHDTTRNTPTSTLFYSVNTTTASPQIVASAIASAQASSPYGVIVHVNGWIYDPSHVPTLNIGDIVSVIVDPDIIGFCDVTVDDNQTGYHSDKYNGYREILHIPKSINPNNVIITHDTLTTVVFDKATNKGVLGHRVDSNAVESITHNDFSMGRTAIQGFSNSLGASEVVVRLYIRMPTDPNYLGDDVNHLSDLYSLPDDEIMQQLMGTAASPIAEWKASHLEQSAFLNLLYEFTGFSSDTAISNYVNAAGYYDVASVLGQQMRRYTYKGAQVEVIKPARLAGIDCQALVFKNGLKVPEGKFVISSYKSNSFLLGFTASSGIQTNDRIALYVTEKGLRTPIPFNPTESVPYLDLDSEDYTLIAVYNYGTAQSVWKTSVTKGYKPFPISPADYTITLNSDGTYRFAVTAQHYGSSFYLVPKYGLTTAVYDLANPITASAPIVLDLTTEDSNGTTVPLMAYETMEVYLNGHRLIDDLDYICKSTLGTNGDILQNLMTICNYDYLDLEGGSNSLEVCIHGDKVISQDTGYAIENFLYRSSVPMIWSRSTSRVYVQGTLQEHVTVSGNIIRIMDDVENGSPFLCQTFMSYGAEKLMADISPNFDNSLRSRIDYTLGLVMPGFMGWPSTTSPSLQTVIPVFGDNDAPQTIGDFLSSIMNPIRKENGDLILAEDGTVLLGELSPYGILVSHLYALYSPFLAAITKDVSDEVFTITDEPNNDMFIKQFKAYSPLLLRDPLIGPDNKLIDRRFASIAAHYVNLSVTDPVQMIRMQRLIELTLTPSPLSIVEVLI